MSLARLKPLYVSLSKKHNSYPNVLDYDPDTTPDSTINAEASIIFRSSLVDKASDYLVAIERLELTLNGIPFYDATDPLDLETIVIRSKLNGALTSAQEIDITAYSLSHLFEILNSYTYTEPNTAGDLQLTFYITKDGIIQVRSSVSFTNIQIEIPRRLNQILGISTLQQEAGKTVANSFFPRTDMGDDLDHLILRTNLPTFTDSIGNVKLSVMTDFAPPSAYSNSLSYANSGELTEAGFSTNLRQKVIYTPSERRYLELLGDFPINDINIEVFYLNHDDEFKRVLLPYGGLFEIKIGFYKIS